MARPAQADEDSDDDDEDEDDLDEDDERRGVTEEVRLQMEGSSKRPQ